MDLSKEYAVAYQMRGLEPRFSHPFYTYSHIWAQPDIVRETVEWLEEPVRALAAKKAGGLKKLYLAGVGSSQNVALIGAQLLGSMAGMEAEGFDSYDWTRSLLRRDLSGCGVLAYTASGATPEVLTALELLPRENTWTLGITNTPESKLASLCDDTLLAPGGTKYMVDFFSRITATYLLAAELGDPALRDVRLARLQNIPDMVRGILTDWDAPLKALGTAWSGKRAVYALGSGITYPVALDTAMRFDECSTIPCKGLTVSQYIHGSIGCSGPDIGMILFAPEGPGYRRLYDAAKIASQVGVSVVAVTNEDNHQLDDFADLVVRVPLVPTELLPFVCAPAGQLIPYYAECAREGGNPDIRRTNQPNYAEAFSYAFRDWEGA